MKGVNFMKKVFCIILSMLMLLSLFGCTGNTDPEDIRGEVSGTTEGNQEEKPEFSLGDTTGSTYTNNFLGISCTLPEGWVFYTDEQMKELNNLVGDYMDEEVAEQLKNATIIYDIIAQNTTDGSSINVAMEKLNVIQIVSLDVKKALEAQIDGIKSTYANIGYTDVQVEYQKLTVDGKEFDSLKIQAKVQGLDFTGVLFAFPKGDYLANVTVCSLSADTVNSVIGSITVK